MIGREFLAATQNVSQLQHFVQQRYLSPWTTTKGKLNVFSTTDRKPVRGRSHRNSCGALDWQPPEFEIAFNNIEQKVQTVIGMTGELAGADAEVH